VVDEVLKFWFWLTGNIDIIMHYKIDANMLYFPIVIVYIELYEKEPDN
jgi:hypothetical protein